MTDGADNPADELKENDMDPNMFGTNEQWARALKAILLVIVALIVGAFALGALVF